MNNIGSGIYQSVATIVIFVFLLAVGIGVFIGKTIWDNGGYIESKSVIQPMIKLTTDGKKVDTLYIYKIK
jgi:hypothetical protein